MAILIVDDESTTRNALREQLTQLGHKTILEAKNGEEALKMAEAEKTRLRMIIADWEMPYMDGITLLDRISQQPELDRAPFLLITSDLPRAKLAELQARTDRLDSFLIKPFRMSALSQAMSAAQAHRASVRRKIVGLSASGSLPSIPPDWDAPVLARTLPELEKAIQAQTRQLGAILIDPRLAPADAAKLTEWLTSFSRTPLGSSTPVLCTSREPAAIFPLRTLCQAYLPQESDWAPRWQALRKKAEASIELELLFQELKSLLQQKKSPAAQKCCEKILALDPSNAEAHSNLGDLLEAGGKHEEALAHYRGALELNPCLPKPYIRLLEGEADERLAIAGEAVAYCPQNCDVLFAAAQACRAAGDLARATELARRILELNSDHAGAKALLTPTP